MSLLARRLMAGAVVTTTAPPPTPDDISGLEGWYDADDSASLTLSGSDVTQWDDLSGNGRHLEGVEGTPTLVSAGLNGRDIIRFAALDNMYVASANRATLSQPNTFFAVMRYESGSRSFAIDAEINSERHILALNESGGKGMYAGTWATGGTSDTSWHIFSALFDTTDSTLREDGAALFTGQDVGTRPFETTNIGGRSTSDGLNGDVAEVLIYSRALTSQEIDDVESYLSSKWGVSLSP